MTLKPRIPKIVEVVSYDPLWPQLFQEEAALIQDVLQDTSLELHHIGSTSVPGLTAKPIIDIIATIKNPKKTITLLKAHSYTYHGAYNLPFRYFFRKYGSSVQFHLHIYPEHYRSEVELNLAFRDYLRTHPEAAAAYADLKHTLLTEPPSLKNRSLFADYTIGKDSFIRDILNKTGFNGTRITCCTHEYEWQATEKFRTMYQLSLDDFIETYASPEHLHVALYQRVIIIGYMHVELLFEEKIMFHIHTFALEEAHENLREQFLKLCMIWLKQKGYSQALLKIRPSLK